MKTRKNGFTIVELVIVIAVIAILAAVLIPTFSNIIKKANLSADKQAVREMNEALAQYEASEGYAVIPDVETVMQVLANAGYNTNNWQCLTAGYEVYWYQNDNRMILYNASTAEIEYPDEYVGTKVMVSAENKFFLYNDNQKQAQTFDMGFSSLDADKAQSSSSLSNSTTIADTNTALTSVSAQNITAIENALQNSTISNAMKNAAGGNSSSNLVYYANREIKKGTANAYVSMQVAAVGTAGNPVVLTNSGEVAENLYYINTVVAENATAEEKKVANQEAAKMVYSIFTQMTTEKVVSNATIILAPNTTLDCSANEWAPCKTFCGYFGTTDAENPVVVSGARLTTATGHAMTVAFNGSSSKYFVTGFFGTIYGDTTIENVKFENLAITNPASDYELTASDRNANKINTRNTVGIIGGIIDNYSDSNPTGTKANVVLRNIEVASTCAITGSGCAGGLVGYIGSNKAENLNLNGDVVIDNCKVHCNVTSTDNASSTGYKSVGGIIGFTCRVDTGLNIAINNCTFDAALNGYGAIGAVAGAFQNNRNVTINGGNYNACTLNANSTAITVNSIAGYCENPSTIVVTGNPALIASLNASSDANGTVVYNISADGKLAQ